MVLLATIFFSVFRYLQPAEFRFFTASPWGIGFLVFEALSGAAVFTFALLLRHRPGWWTLERLRVLEYVLVCDMAVYVGWTQLFAFAGVRFGVTGSADPLIIRIATDSMAVRWTVVIVGLSTLIPETFARNNMLVGLQVLIAMALTTTLALTDPVYAPRASRMVALMGFWMTLAATIAIFGAARLQELRQQVAEARRLGQYQLMRLLGAGGMGEVHLAEHVLLKQPVAIKLIRPERAGDPDALARFEREVRATARLKHWNTVQIYDYGFAADGTFYYVMEYLPGMTLEEIVHRRGPMPASRVIHFLRQVCSALREAHAMHLLHRDIKPANIMVCERGGVFDVAKLLDFGLVRTGGPAADTIFDDHLVVGTPGFMSPEQAQGRDNLAPASDIYALGATGYFLLTGKPIVTQGHPLQMLIAQASAPIPSPAALGQPIPPDLESVIMRCLEHDPTHRFDSAEALDHALARCADADHWSAADAEAWWRAHPDDSEPAAAVSHARVTMLDTIGAADQHNRHRVL